MINLGVLLVGFILGIFSLGLLVFLVVLHKPRVSAPTLRRKNRDKPLPVGGYQPLGHTPMPPPPMPSPAREAEIGGIEYRFMGATGLEE
jgi:hypothetical protein